MKKISRKAYSEMFGPTVGDQIRLGDTELIIEIEKDYTVYGDEVKFGGGRFGKDIDGSDINDDGISHKKEGGLKLQVEYETLKTGMSKVYAKLV